MRQVLILLALAVLPTMALDLAAAGRLPAGTEIVELRSPGARHYSNGDGTLRAEIGGEPDGTDTLVAVIAGFTDRWDVVGVVFYASGLTEMKLWYFVALWYRITSNAWAEWNTSSIPNEATIERVSVRMFSVYHEGFDQFDRLWVHEMVHRPSLLGRSGHGDTTKLLYDDCADGPVYAVVPPPGDTVWHEYRLNEDAVRTLQEQLSEGWFAIGMTGGEYHNYFAWSCYEGTEETPRQLWPRLVVEYAGGVAEEKSLPVAGHRFTIGPNPLSGGIATLRFEGLGHNPKSQKDLGYVPRLTVNVFDVTGRSVLSRSITTAQSGAVSLDLRELVNGVYLVRIQMDGFASEKKLVVQR